MHHEIFGTSLRLDTHTTPNLEHFVAFHLQASGGLMFGYDNGVSGGVSNMNPFLRKFYPSVLAKKLAGNNASPYCKVCSTQLRLICDPASMLRLQAHTMQPSCATYRGVAGSCRRAVSVQQFDDQKLQTFTSCLFLAGLVASFPAAWVTTKKGRKVSMVRHCVPVYDIF